MTDADPARLYRDVIGELSAAADALRAHDEARAVALRLELVELDKALVEAEKRTTLSRVAVEIRWEMVLDALWKEQWLTLRPRPQPDPDADPERLGALDREADLAANAVEEAVQTRFPFLR